MSLTSKPLSLIGLVRSLGGKGSEVKGGLRGLDSQLLFDIFVLRIWYEGLCLIRHVFTLVCFEWCPEQSVGEGVGDKDRKGDILASIARIILL